MEGRKWENKSSFSSKWNDHDYTGVGKRGFKELLTLCKIFHLSTVVCTCAIEYHADKKSKWKILYKFKNYINMSMYFQISIIKLSSILELQIHLNFVVTLNNTVLWRTVPFLKRFKRIYYKKINLKFLWKYLLWIKACLFSEHWSGLWPLTLHM